jgi:L-cysteine S-thiosulfotransferase
MTRLNASEATNPKAPPTTAPAMIAGNSRMNFACPVAFRYAPKARLPIVNMLAKVSAPTIDDAQAACTAARATDTASQLHRVIDAIALCLHPTPRGSLTRRMAQEGCAAGGFLTSVACIAFFCILTILPSLASEIALQDRRSAYLDMSRESKAMQDDDTANPGMLAVLDGEALWNRKAGAADRSCADCHGDATQSMIGIAARYPAFDAPSGKPIDLEERINLERTDRQKAPPLRHESDDLLALSAYVARQSRGEPIAPPQDERLAPFVAAGREFFNKRQGQLNLSCALCHDDNWSKRLAGNIVPQGHPTGYPLYRLEWQSVGSLQRRLRNCISGMRAEVPEYGSPEYINLELFLMWRARGMPMESPAVRP